MPKQTARIELMSLERYSKRWIYIEEKKESKFQEADVLERADIEL